MEIKKRAGRKPVHGMTGTPIFGHWLGMIGRCQNPRNKAYKDYGGRGITVCERWQNVLNFHADMGAKPPGMFLDRIDNDGPYSPENCRWATPKQSANNRRNSRIVKIGDREMTLTQWCDELGVPNGRVHARVYVYGWEPKDALLAPINTKIKHLKKIDPPSTGELKGVSLRLKEPV